MLCHRFQRSFASAVWCCAVLAGLISWLTMSRVAPAADSAKPPRPNIVFVLCDDLGYGDVKAFNPDGKIATPNVDRLAAQGMMFTDAHTTSSVCTPTRYGLLTGRYNWRSRLQSGVLGGLSPPLIEPGRMTVASLLKTNGYHTACFGKWHLGMEWPLKSGKFGDNIEQGSEGWRVDFSQPIRRGPTTNGFDEYFGISASLDMVPYTYIENDRVAVIPTVDKEFLMMHGKPAGGSTRKGPGAEKFEADDVLPALTRRAVDYIGRRAADAKQGRPFFLYLPLASPHTPIAPTSEWLGKSGLNPYADFVQQTDAAVGQLLDALERHQLTEDTLFVFTSDNGCSPQADYPALAAKQHNPSYKFRGTKADIFEGGHRVPFVVRWPAKVRAGTKCEQTISLVDFMATCADVLGVTLPDNAGEDSVSFRPALEGHVEMPLREALVHHSINGSFAIRQGPWKLCLCGDSGGWSDPKPNSKDAAALAARQLFNLADDIGERRNVEAEHPEVAARLLALLEKYVADGRSTPGEKQSNAVPIKIWKGVKRAVAEKPEKNAKSEKNLKPAEND